MLIKVLENICTKKLETLPKLYSLTFPCRGDLIPYETKVYEPCHDILKCSSVKLLSLIRLWNTQIIPHSCTSSDFSPDKFTHNQSYDPHI